MSPPSDSSSTHRFTPTALLLCGGLLIWAADFLIVYVVAAVACAKGYAASSIAGVPFVTFIGTSVTLLAGLATAALVRVVLGRWRDRDDGPSGFMYFLALTISLIALLAMFFNVLPVWLLSSEC